MLIITPNYYLVLFLNARVETSNMSKHTAFPLLSLQFVKTVEKQFTAFAKAYANAMRMPRESIANETVCTHTLPVRIKMQRT